MRQGAQHHSIVAPGAGELLAAANAVDQLGPLDRGAVSQTEQPRPEQHVRVCRCGRTTASSELHRALEEVFVDGGVSPCFPERCEPRREIDRFIGEPRVERGVERRDEVVVIGSELLEPRGLVGGGEAFGCGTTHSRPERDVHPLRRVVLPEVFELVAAEDPDRRSDLEACRLGARERIDQVQVDERAELVEHLARRGRTTQGLDRVDVERPRDQRQPAQQALLLG